jgi:hypothetical protein
MEANASKPVGAVALLLMASLAGCTGTTPSPDAGTAASPPGPAPSNPPAPPPPPQAPPPAPAPSPSPSSAPVTATISAAEGGTLRSADRVLTLRFPPGAFAQDTVVTVSGKHNFSADELGGMAVGAYDVVPANASLAKPASATFEFPLLLGGAPAPPSLLPALPAIVDGQAVDVLGDAFEEVEHGNATAKAGGTTLHLGTFVEGLHVPVGIVENPTEVVAFVDDAWNLTAHVTNGNPSGAAVQISGAAAIAEGAVWTVQGPEASASIGVEDNLTAQFQCRTAGVGGYGLEFQVQTWVALGGGAARNVTWKERDVYPALCVPHVRLTATLAPPHTEYRLDAPPITGDVRIQPTFTWIAAISCGTFAAQGTRSVDGGADVYRDATDAAAWAHPNAPSSALANQDADGDGIPDYCPHSETANFSHAGAVTAEVRYEPPSATARSSALLTCRHSGSLTGEDACALTTEART